MKIGMEHNVGLTEDQDASQYLKRDLVKRKDQKPPYKIIRDEIVGRHMVASREIKAGEVIFKELPLTFGPSEMTRPVCLGCYKEVDIRTPTCDKCGFPMCCDKIKVHQEFECSTFGKNNYKVNASTFNFGEDEPAYSVISPLRTFILQSKNPELFNLVWMQMSHLAKRRESQFWVEKTKKVLDLLKTMAGLEEKDEPVIEAILGIHLVNDFEISMQDRTVEENTTQSIRGLFGLASMPNHDCLANTTHEFSSADGFAMTVKALTDIQENQDITHNYTEPLDPVLSRQGVLKMGKFFMCLCKRCSDPTELGTYSSALKCPKCKKGIVVSSNPSDLDAPWSCQSCQESVTPDKVAKVTQAVKEASEKLDADPKIDDFEAFLKKFSDLVHENHVILVDKKYTLAKMYGRMKGYEADEMSDDQFKRKRDLCEQVLAILDKIMPGRSRKRGMIKYELHLPLVMITNRNLQRGPACGVSPDVLKSGLKSGLANLKEALDILSDEPEGSFEHRIVQGSQESVKQLEDWVSTVCNTI